MLLTPSQVSIAISSGVVVVFTTALFLSGYAIQQRTLRDLRLAIKPSPRPTPLIFLPDRFKQTTTELEDGTTVQVEIDLGEDKYRPPRSSTQEDTIIEIKHTQPEEDEEADLPAELPRGGRLGGDMGGSTKTHRLLQGVGSPPANDEGTPQKPISRAERRRKLREDIRRLSQADKPMIWQRRLW